jgi:formylglycine-generating enzyme required for sulfatase activity
MNSPVQKIFTEPAMIRIPEGWFLMGCATGRDDEQPAHRVWIDSFELAAYQVTHNDYARFLAATERPHPPLWDDPGFNQPTQPVVAVSWHDAIAYCEWLSEITGGHYRLPTEAEWERACRGGLEGKLYSWGDDPPESLPNYAERWKNAPEPVGRYAPNGYGLYDIGDNVHEWCADWYDPGYYARSPERNPSGPAAVSLEGAGTGRSAIEMKARRASRGGSWRHHVKVARCAARSSIPPEFKYADYGFRIARDVK